VSAGAQAPQLGVPESAKLAVVDVEKRSGGVLLKISHTVQTLSHTAAVDMYVNAGAIGCTRHRAFESPSDGMQVWRWCGAV
jgi:hypothetical protein